MDYYHKRFNLILLMIIFLISGAVSCLEFGFLSLKSFIVLGVGLLIFYNSFKLGVGSDTK